MKLPRNLFPPVELTPEQCTTYESLAESVVAQALHEYDDFNIKRGRQLDRKRWKQIKKSDDITVYQERSRRSSSAGGSGKSSAASSRSSSVTSRSVDQSSQFYSGSEDGSSNRDSGVMGTPVSKISTTAVSSIAEDDVIAPGAKRDSSAIPKLLAVGRVPGTVEDMLYGMSSPTLVHSKIKTAYVDDEVADMKPLYEIKGATPYEPLRYVGLKWIIKGHSAVIGTLVRQRDIVFVESIGLKDRPDGSRIGYFVMHSVEIPGVRELTEYSIVRARASLVYILRQNGPGQIEIFMKSFLEPSGSIPKSIAVLTAVNSLISIAAVSLGGHHRKLGWAATKKLRTPSHPTATSLPLSAEAHCSNCYKTFTRFSTTLACFFCSTRVCSKCSEQRNLTIPSPDARLTTNAKPVTKMSMNACTRCYSTVFRNQRAEDVAREEVLAGEYGSVPKGYYQSKTRRSPSAAASANGLNVADLQGLTISRQQSSDSSRGRHASSRGGYEAYLQSQQQHAVDFSGSVVELDRNDFVRASSGPAAYHSSGAHSSQLSNYTGQHYHHSVAQPMAYSPYPSYGASGQPMGGYGGAPVPTHMAYGGQQPMGYGGVPPPQAAPSDDLYTRIAKLNQTAEQVYQYTKRTANNSTLGGNEAPMMRS